MLERGRKFYEMLFHGNGDYSQARLKKLVDRLIDGHTMLGGMQQAIPIDSEEYKEGEEFNKDVCRDVLASFGFSDEGLLWKQLPYPNYDAPPDNE